MNLPDLNKLNETWHICQNQDPVDGGYCAVIDDHGMQVMENTRKSNKSIK